MFLEKIKTKIQDRGQLAETIADWKAKGERIEPIQGLGDDAFFTQTTGIFVAMGPLTVSIVNQHRSGTPAKTVLRH